MHRVISSKAGARAERESGQTMVEYAMLISIIIIGVILSIYGVGDAVFGLVQETVAIFP